MRRRSASHCSARMRRISPIEGHLGWHAECQNIQITASQTHTESNMVLLLKVPASDLQTSLTQAGAPKTTVVVRAEQHLVRFMFLKLADAAVSYISGMQSPPTDSSATKSRESL